MPYKTPRIQIFPNLLGTEKRVQDLQIKISELDWLEYSFGLAKRVTIMSNEDTLQTPVVYVGVNQDPIPMPMWPDDSWHSYAFWDLMDRSEFLYFDNVGGHRRHPKIQQPVALIVCLNNKLISNHQDHNLTHSICKNELIEKLNTSNMSNGIFQITGVLENLPTEVFDGYDVEDQLMEPNSMIRIEGMLTYTQDCTTGDTSTSTGAVLLLEDGVVLVMEDGEEFALE